MNRVTVYPIVVGILAGVLSTFAEAFVAFHEELHFLWPWAGFFLYMPGLITILLTGVAIAISMRKRAMPINPRFGIYFGISAMLTFFVFDNLIVFPIFIAPVIWPWQDFFFNFRFPVGLIDTLANGFLIFLIGCWIEYKYVKGLDVLTREIALKALVYLKYVILVLSLIYIVSLAAAMLFSLPYILTKSFLSIFIVYATPIASVILFTLWINSYYALHKIDYSRIESLLKAYSTIRRNTIINAIINEIVFFYEISFLYPFAIHRVKVAFPNLPQLGMALIQAYLIALSFQIIFLITAWALLQVAKKETV